MYWLATKLVTHTNYAISDQNVLKNTSSGFPTEGTFFSCVEQWHANGEAVSKAALYTLRPSFKLFKRENVLVVSYFWQCFSDSCSLSVFTLPPGIVASCSRQYLWVVNLIEFSTIHLWVKVKSTCRSPVKHGRVGLWTCAWTFVNGVPAERVQQSCRLNMDTALSSSLRTSVADVHCC